MWFQTSHGVCAGQSTSHRPAGEPESATAAGRAVPPNSGSILRERDADIMELTSFQWARRFPAAKTDRRRRSGDLGTGDRENCRSRRS
jgi:hypothetical protein